MKPAWGVLAIVALLLAGCVSPGPGTSTMSSTSGTTTPSATCNGYGGPGCDPPRRTATLYISVNGAEDLTLDVPFPHLDRCLSQDAWRNGIQPGTAGSLTMAEGERGWVLRLTGTGDLSRSARIFLDDFAACQTFRYDPWSIEPDPADGTLDVRASAAVDVHILLSVSTEDPYCWDWTSFDGPVVAGWTTLTAEDSMVCA